MNNTSIPSGSNPLWKTGEHKISSYRPMFVQHNQRLCAQMQSILLHYICTDVKIKHIVCEPPAHALDENKRANEVLDHLVGKQISSEINRAINAELYKE